MDKIWITFLLMIIAVIDVQTSGQSVVNVQLVVKKYAERGSDVTLYCENDAAPDIVYKVTFLKGENKIFEYIKGRNPPYRNYSIAGAEIDWKKVTLSTLTLKNVDYEASGSYYCEVSTDTPIFTKASNEEPFHVILSQKGPPTIEFAKKQLYYGDMLKANCTTSKAKPAPHITWLINGKPVEDKYVRHFHHTPKGSHRSKQLQQSQQLQEKQQLTPPSSVTSQSSFHHGKVVAGTSASSGPASGLKEFKAVAREITERKASQSMNGYSPYKDNGVGGNFEIQPNTFYNSYDGFYGRVPQRDRDRSGALGVFNIEGHRQGDEANENGEESDKKTSWLKNNYHTNMYYDNKQQQQQQQQHYDSGFRKHHTSYDRKMRRHVNDATGGDQRKHRPVASHSQLAIRITEALTNNVGRIEITCLATIPAHVEPGEQYADYKTSLIKLDIEQNDLTSPEPSTGSLAHAKSDAVQTSNFQASSGLCRNLLALQCGIVALLLLYHRRAAAAWFLFSSLT
ncbi:uncharacterized protein beat-VII [Ochlerotatus camptorhynchus]|uniref:uncharacterized protein beat-VII n=1 Tax=Ochlerotatus camptorhynchus TaxID=644619 RepID=UPI0031D79DA1